MLASTWKQKRKEILKDKLFRGVGRWLKPTTAPATKTFLAEVEELTSRTRCNCCDTVGHWSREGLQTRTEGDHFPECEPRFSCLFESTTKVAVSEHVQHSGSCNMCDGQQYCLGFVQSNNSTLCCPIVSTGSDRCRTTTRFTEPFVCGETYCV